MKKYVKKGLSVLFVIVPLFLLMAPLARAYDNTIEYYDIPLSEYIQNEVFKECKKNNINRPDIIIAMIFCESSYDESKIGDYGESFGLMQIQPKWNAERMQKLGIKNLFDPVQNVRLGVDIFAEKLQRFESIELALIAYNAGDSVAIKAQTNRNIADYSYAISVINYAFTLNRR